MKDVFVQISLFCENHTSISGQNCEILIIKAGDMNSNCYHLTVSAMKTIVVTTHSCDGFAVHKVKRRCSPQQYSAILTNNEILQSGIPCFVALRFNDALIIP
jgi:hypothetical protein